MWWVWKREDLRGESQPSSNTPKRKGRKQSAEGLCCCCSVTKPCPNLCNSMVQKEKRVAEDEMRWLRASYVSSTMLSIIRPQLTAFLHQ